jgi:hypothetical protein
MATCMATGPDNRGPTSVVAHALDIDITSGPRARLLIAGCCGRQRARTRSIAVMNIALSGKTEAARPGLLRG